VHDNVAVVEQHPAGFRCAFAAPRADLFGLAQLPVDRLQDGVDLAVGAGAGDDKIIGEGRDTANVQQQDVLRLFFGENVSYSVRQLFRLQMRS
jgi:hypothetical protein